jgi:hypothetical protein
MLRLWCYLFGHRLLRPKIANPGMKSGKGKGKDGYYTHCKRCNTLMVRDYFDGWQPASPREHAYYLRYFGPNAKPHEAAGE